MKKTLLTLAALMAAGQFAANADVKVYNYDYLGDVNGVADNGRFVAISDPENFIAYLWDSNKPDDLADISNLERNEAGREAAGTTVCDVSDDGVAVGSITFEGSYVEFPAYYKDGKWNRLPLDPTALNTNCAVAITPDGKVIAGYQFMKDPTADQGGRYYPCQWFLQEDGSYELKSYTPKLPDHQGFFTTAQTPDGKVVTGSVYCGIGSQINAFIKDGELVLFDEVVTKEEPWMYKGKYYCGKDENGKQIWSEDPNDERIVLFEEEYINGYKDDLGDEYFLVGFFDNCDDQGNLYGARNRTDNLDEEGHGDHRSDACIYNYLTDTWHVEEGINYFSAGIGTDLLFTGEGEMIKGSEVEDVAEVYNPESPYEVVGISKISRDAKTLGGVSRQFNQAIGDYQYFPFIVLVDGGTAGVQSVTGDPRKALVVAYDGIIEVVNAEEVAVYDMNGRLVGTGAKTAVMPGVYVVKTDGASYKIRVK